MANAKIVRTSKASSVQNFRQFGEHLADEGLLLAVLILPAPNLLSLSWGGFLSLSAIALIFWLAGYQRSQQEVVGPYRFVRHPETLALWLLSLSLAVAARSFAAVSLTLILLPWLFLLREDENRMRIDSSSLKYRYSIPSLIPTLIPFTSSSKLRFSWRRAVKIQKWPGQSRLISAVIAWIYLSVIINFKLPFWTGILLALGYGAIKLFKQKNYFLRFAFRKKL